MGTVVRCEDEEGRDRWGNEGMRGRQVEGTSGTGGQQAEGNRSGQNPGGSVLADRIRNNEHCRAPMNTAGPRLGCGTGWAQ